MRLLQYVFFFFKKYLILNSKQSLYLTIYYHSYPPYIFTITIWTLAHKFSVPILGFFVFHTNWGFIFFEGKFKFNLNIIFSSYFFTFLKNFTKLIYDFYFKNFAWNISSYIGIHLDLRPRYFIFRIRSFQLSLGLFLICLLIVFMNIAHIPIEKNNYLLWRSYKQWCKPVIYNLEQSQI